MLRVVKHARLLWAVVAIEVMAIVLAMLQWRIGVRTDEAKYLLSIPYPHPPLARTVLQLTETVPFQELFWRILLATLLLQAVWLVWDMGRSLPRGRRIALAGAWILSAAVLLQAGTIMMAPLTALHGLLFLWLLSRESSKEYPGIIALLWIGSLFTAYQAVLFIPLIWVLIRRSGRRRQSPVNDGNDKFVAQCAYVFIPVILLGLYTLSNPLALSSMFLQAGKDIAETPLERILATFRVWALGGSIVVSTLGTIGIVLSRRLDLIGSFLLVFAFTLLARHDYYAILWTPLFIAGAGELLQKGAHNEKSTLVGMLFLMFHLVFLLFFPLSLQGSPARETIRMVRERVSGSGVLLIAGAFGHEWQYESPFLVRRLTPGSDLAGAAAIVCLAACPKDLSRDAWRPLEDAPFEVWIR